MIATGVAQPANAGLQEVVLPDMDELLCCEWGTISRSGEESCGLPAEWVLYRGCCMDKALTVLYCSGHKNLVILSRALWCAFCAKRWSPGGKFWVIIEPLGRKPSS